MEVPASEPPRRAPGQSQLQEPAVAPVQTPMTPMRPTIDPEMPAVRLDPGRSLPPAGRSIFDHILGDEPVPYPFEKLIAFLADRASSKVVSTLIQKGRSLLRHANDEAPFKFPRVIVGFET